MAEPMGWGRRSGCELLQKKCSELDVSKYPKMFCQQGDPHLRCTSDRYFSGTCDSSIIETLPGGLWDICPIINPAVGVKDFGDVFKAGAQASVRPGDKPSAWCLDTVPTTVAGEDGDESSAAMHAGVKCLGAQVHLQQTRHGRVDWQSCTEGAKVPWEISPHGPDKVICPDYDEVCTISATGRSIIPATEWDGEEKVWRRTAPAASVEEPAPPEGGPDSGKDVPPQLAPPSARGDGDAAGGGGAGNNGRDSGAPSREQGSRPCGFGEPEGAPAGDGRGNAAGDRQKRRLASGPRW
ncbi:surface protease GP63 [Trypanosoma rangeli SC58]|uniref:Leishmanolysin-like peptidase n=1 Tax=Trypanosoma rangeli SC58 TaxID=429131 RepID=A0A061IS79_TRYRA|nr:surface protease GP63 [Trypanosoma rangeli SC58]